MTAEQLKKKLARSAKLSELKSSLNKLGQQANELLKMENKKDILKPKLQKFESIEVEVPRRWVIYEMINIGIIHTFYCPYQTTDPLSAAEDEQKLPSFTQEQWEGAAVRAGPKFTLLSIATCYYFRGR